MQLSYIAIMRLTFAFVICVAITFAVNAEPIVKLGRHTGFRLENNEWNVISWEYSEFDDLMTWLSSTTIVVPSTARARCSCQISLQSPNGTEFRVKMTLNGGNERDLPFMIHSLPMPGGLNKSSAYGPWIPVGYNERFRIGDSIEVTVWIDGTGAFVDASSWAQCEWSNIIFESGFEIGSPAEWESSYSWR